MGLKRMNIDEINESNRQRAKEFFVQHWGSPIMVIASGTYNCSELEGYMAIDESEQTIGLITYMNRERCFEILSLDSVVEKRGVGTALMVAVETLAKQKGAKAIHLVTTNDNLHALGFYQKRGYVLYKLHKDAVKKARLIKPEIPFVAENQIPIRDEIECVKYIV